MFDLQFYQKLSNHNPTITGIDEVGRGPLAGPVVSCSVSFTQKLKDENEFEEFLNLLSSFNVTDSKKLTINKRKKIIEDLSIELDIDQKKTIIVSENAQLNYFISEISVDEIDKINILNASLKSMKNSFENLKTHTGIVLIDGNKKFKTDYESTYETVVKGDSKSLLIGLASIIAKEYRDLLMSDYDEKYPGYFWKDNAGYGTKKHLDAILELGVTPIHRTTFKGVKEHCEQRL